MTSHLAALPLVAALLHGGAPPATPPAGLALRALLSAPPRFETTTVATGRIVDPGGQPIAGAWVRATPRPDELAPVPPPGSGWSPPDEQWKQTDADGRFRLVGTRDTYGADGAEIWVLAGRRYGEPTVRVRSAVGVRALELTLEPLSRLEVDFSLLSAKVRRETHFGILNARGDWCHGLGRSGDRATALLNPGVYTLLGRIGGRELVRIEGLEVPPQGGCRDPRLAPLDLGFVLDEREVVVVDAQGEPVRAVHVHYRGTGPEGFWYASKGPAERGRAVWIHGPGEDWRVAVTAPGFDSVEVSDLGDGAVVVLHASRTVDLLFAPGCEPPPGKKVILRRAATDLPYQDRGILRAWYGGGVLHARLIPGVEYDVIVPPDSTNWSVGPDTPAAYESITVERGQVAVVVR